MDLFNEFMGTTLKLCETGILALLKLIFVVLFIIGIGVVLPLISPWFGLGIVLLGTFYLIVAIWKQMQDKHHIIEIVLSSIAIIIGFAVFVVGMLK